MKIPIIVSGGIRNGVEIVKALAMGASLAGMAMPFLKPAVTSTASVHKTIEAFKQEIRNTLFLIGAKSLKDVDTAKLYRLGDCP